MNRLFYHVLFFFSGAAGLGYQVVWVKQWTAGLGHEVPAVYSVVAAFLGGLGLGAWWCDKRIKNRPRIWYAALEAGIGAWGACSLWIVPAVAAAAARWIGIEPSPAAHWGLAFLLPFVVLLPATAAMGATLPVMEAILAPMSGDRRCVGGIYAANTAGAVAGVLGAAFWLVPTAGLTGAGLAFASVNLACAGFAWKLLGTARQETCPEPNAPVDLGERRLWVALFVTGCLGIGYELAAVRALSQILENTVFSFATLLAVYLTATSAGAAVYQKSGIAWRTPRSLSLLLLGCAVAVVAGTAGLGAVPQVYYGLRNALPDHPMAVFGSELAAASAVFLLPALVMGAVFSALVQTARFKFHSIGRAIALNMTGGMLAAPLFGLILLPALGIHGAMLGAAAGYLLLMPKPTCRRVGVGLAVIAGGALVPVDLRLQRIPPGARLLEYRQGVMASVSVIEYRDGHRTLRVNNRFQMGGTGGAVPEKRHAHIPLLLHPRPQKALFLGIGTGITFAAAATHESLHADGVELVPEMLELLDYFRPANEGLASPRLKLHVGDARRFVRATGERYDVIVADLFHPARDGAALLYTREHFEAIRARLDRGGLFCQWLPMHQLSFRSFQLIARTFLEVFPDAEAYLLRLDIEAPAVALIGGRTPFAYDADWIETRARGTLQAELGGLGLGATLQVLGCYLAGSAALAQIAGTGVLNTDDNQRLLFDAPAFTYRKGARPAESLFELLSRSSREQASSVRGLGLADRSFERDLLGYLAARDLYLEGLQWAAEGDEHQAIRRYVESANRSRHFTLGYAQCIRWATAMAKSNPAAAEALLLELEEAQPGRGLARELLNRLFKP